MTAGVGAQVAIFCMMTPDGWESAPTLVEVEKMWQQRMIDEELPLMEAPAPAPDASPADAPAPDLATRVAYLEARNRELETRTAAAEAATPKPRDDESRSALPVPPPPTAVYGQKPDPVERSKSRE